MKKLNSIVCLLFFVSISQAQVSYLVNPTPTVNLSLALKQTTASKIYLSNTSSNPILLKWERVLVNLPVGWSYTSCDNSFCYGGVPTGTKTMDSIANGGQGFLGLDIDPDTISGTGIVKIYVYQDGYYAQGDTLTWNISTNVVGRKKATLSNEIAMYPNPVNDVLTIVSKAEYLGSNLRITDLLGRQVMQEKITSTLSTIDVSSLTNGNYFLIIDNNQQSITQKFIKH